MIRFHVLGAGGAMPTSTHGPAAHWVVVDHEPLLVDPGPGALVRLVRSDLAPRGVDEIGRVLLSHLHPDHTGDLVALLFALHSPLPQRTDPLLLDGPPGLVDLLGRLHGIYGRWLDPRSRELIVREHRPGACLTLAAGGSVTTFATDHPQDRLAELCLGFRFQDAAGRTVVYSGDTGPGGELAAAARDTDLLVVECSTSDELATAGHMTPTRVAELCRRCRPRRTVLIHQYPPAAALDLAALIGRSWDGPVHQARDGDSFTVGDEEPEREGHAS